MNSVFRSQKVGQDLGPLYAGDESGQLVADVIVETAIWRGEERTVRVQEDGQACDRSAGGVPMTTFRNEDCARCHGKGFCAICDLGATAETLPELPAPPTTSWVEECMAKQYDR